MRLNINSLFKIISAVKEYLFSYQKFGKKFQLINSLSDLESFINERSAYVTQTTLYGYLKTRMGLKYALMFSEDIFIQSVNKSKWNIFVVAASDLTLFTVSILSNRNQLNLTNDGITKVYNSVLNDQITKGMPEELLNSALEKFKDRINNTNINFYSKEKPFESSGLALYEWSPIADNLKVLDKEIVLNSIKNKWMHVINDFDKLSKNFKN